MKSVSRIANLCATISLAATLLISAAIAAPGHWYEPGREGHGLQINRDTGYGNAVTWYIYRPDGSTAFLVSGENCQSFPCVVTLHEPTANFMGGQPFLGQPVGIIEVGQYHGQTLPVRYDLRAWRPDECLNTGPGGALFNQCFGEISFELLAE